MLDKQRMADEQRVQAKRVAEGFQKLVAQPEWQYVVKYLEGRASVLLSAILAPSSGSDGMSIALSAERNKGALQELQEIPRYIDTIIKQYGEERKSPHNEAAADEVPGVDRMGPRNEGEAAASTGV